MRVASLVPSSGTVDPVGGWGQVEDWESRGWVLLLGGSRVRKGVNPG